MNENRTSEILDDIFDERERQDKKWGEQHWPDGTAPERSVSADAARFITDQRFKSGSLTWLHILREEFLETAAEVGWPELRKELIQVAAVCVAWVEDGDQRQA